MSAARATRPGGFRLEFDIKSPSVYKRGRIEGGFNIVPHGATEHEAASMGGIAVIRFTCSWPCDCLPHERTEVHSSLTKAPPTLIHRNHTPIKGFCVVTMRLVRRLPESTTITRQKYQAAETLSLQVTFTAFKRGAEVSLLRRVPCINVKRPYTP